MAFPTTPILDDFNTGALQNVTSRAGWSPNVFNPGEPTLTTDAAPTYAVSGAAFASNYWAATFTDCEFYATLGSVLATLYLYTRTTNPNSTTPSGYDVDWTIPGGTWVLHKVTAGVYATLTSGTQAANAGDQLGISSIGTTHTVYINGVSVGSAIDATYASGVLATEVANTGRIDSFGGGAPVTGPPTSPRNTAGWMTRSGGY